MYKKFACYIPENIDQYKMLFEEKCFKLFHAQIISIEIDSNFPMLYLSLNFLRLIIIVLVCCYNVPLLTCLLVSNILDQVKYFLVLWPSRSLLKVPSILPIFIATAMK